MNAKLLLKWIYLRCHNEDYPNQNKEKRAVKQHWDDLGKNISRTAR